MTESHAVIKIFLKEDQESTREGLELVYIKWNETETDVYF